MNLNITELFLLIFMVLVFRVCHLGGRNFHNFWVLCTLLWESMGIFDFNLIFITSIPLVYLISNKLHSLFTDNFGIKILRGQFFGRKYRLKIEK